MHPMDVGPTHDEHILMDEDDEYSELDMEWDEEAEAQAQATENAYHETLRSPNLPINFESAIALDAAPVITNDELPGNSVDSEEVFIQGGLVEDGNDDDRVLIDGEDEDEDESGSEDETNTTSKKKKREYIPLPPWLMDAYKKHLKACNNRDKATNRPPLYCQKTFWFPVTNNFFALESTKLKPSDLYHTPFFLWDPECLLPPNAPLLCRCKQRLTRMGAATRPRAVVGTEGLFYIIAFRYRCNSCALPTAQMKKTSTTSNSKVAGKTSSYSSTSEHIMSQLPLHLAMEFPAILTHRRGISKELFALMRSCFHTNGMGSKQFADILRVNASRRYDEMDLRYHAGIVSRRQKGTLLTGKFPEFPAHNDQSSEGLHDYSPSSQLLQDIYDKLIEEHEGEIDKLMSMVKVTVAAVDHSHRVSIVSE
jgi:hypothetical protein